MRAFVHRWFACASASLLLTMAACAGGCGGKVTLRSWQSAVESYVLEEGNGDVGVLRNVTIAGGQRGFAVLGKAKAAESSDAAGLLVASRQVGGRNWYIYLLGLVRKGDVVEMRLVALGVPVAGAARAGDDSEEGFVWAVGQADEVGFGHYVDYHEHAWESRHGGRAGEFQRRARACLVLHPG